MCYCKSLIPCVGLYEDFACTEVILDLKTISKSVSHLLNSILTQLTFYSTELLSEFLRLFHLPLLQLLIVTDVWNLLPFPHSCPLHHPTPYRT